MLVCISGVGFTKVFRTGLGHKYILVECYVIALCLPVMSKLPVINSCAINRIMIGMSIKRISVLNLCHVLKPFVKSTPDVQNLAKIGINEPRHVKTNKMNVRPAKTPISLGICPVWSESSLSVWKSLGPYLSIDWPHSEDSDQTWRMPMLIRVFAGRTLILLVLSCRGSFVPDFNILWLPFMSLWTRHNYNEHSNETLRIIGLIKTWK